MSAPDGFDEEGQAVDDASSDVARAWEKATEWVPADDPAPDAGDDWDADLGDDGRENPPDVPGAGLPDNCPVVPLGVQGRVYYFLDALKQLQEVPWKDLQRSVIVGLFGVGARDYLRRQWPRKSQDKNTGEWIITGWAPEEVQFDLAEGCARKGVWSPRARVRGAGAWKEVDGALILHCGDRVYRFPAAGGARPESNEPGVIGEHVYPAYAPTPRPFGDPQTARREDGAGWRLLGLFKTWNWARPQIDPVLLLGWVCAGMIGGAVKFRPMIWMTGEHATGKSTLQDYIKWLYGTTGLLSVANASAAGIAQTLGYSSLPAALDEQEASADNRKAIGIIELAREAATGAMRVRGSSDHDARSFNIQSAFAFSSILIPPMEPADVSRFAVLELHKLPEGAKPPNVTEPEINELGRRLLRRMVDGWPRFAATLAAYRDALMVSGRHSGRGADLFGTLLACADLVLSDTLPSADTLARWAERLDATQLAELDGALTDSQQCLQYLLTKTITDQHNRRERTIAAWVSRAHGHESESEGDRIHANEILALHGMKWIPKDGYHYLAVSNNHQGVATLFRDTKWGAAAGTNGGWRQSLGRLDGAVKGHQVKFPPNNRCVLVPLAHFLSDIPAPPGDGQDSSAAGGSPGTASAAGTPPVEASHRSAADTAFDRPGPDPLASTDPFALTDYP